MNHFYPYRIIAKAVFLNLFVLLLLYNNKPNYCCIKYNNKLINGSGKLCRELNINKNYNNIDMIHNSDFTLLNNDPTTSILYNT